MSAQQYRLHGFRITVDSSLDHIIVEPCTDADQDCGQVPDWIFESQDVLWIAEGSAPLSVRAIRGEEIKRRISGLRAEQLVR